ncbi:MAG: tetratricopeptide repeat protein [Verrucomicrobiales bacterium]|nr:tetratricopeptide repeat protein [Verrucomicrobiales bacterium]
MNIPTRCIAISLAISTLSVSQAQGFLDGLFSKPGNGGAEESVINQSAADAKLAQAQQAESSGNARKARDLYRSITKSYPNSDAAAKAQFRYAKILQNSGDEKKAFDAYEDLISNYRNTPDFNEAVMNQFAIAEKLQTTEKKGFLGLGASVQPSKLIEMFESIAEAAPYTEFAPRALINISKVHVSEQQIPQALASLKLVTDTYQGTKYATEAQYEIFRLRGVKAENSNSPQEDRAQVEAGIDFMSQNPNDERAQDIQANLREIEERTMEKRYNTGLFYEKSGKPESARVYYREVVKNPNTPWAAKAQARLTALDNAPPSVEKKAGFFGPNPIKKDEVEMRTSEDSVVPLPSGE